MEDAITYATSAEEALPAGENNIRKKNMQNTKNLWL